MKIKITNFDQIELVQNLSVEEQETTISWGRGDNNISIYTCDNTVLNKLKRLAIANPKAWVCYYQRDSKQNITGYFFETSKKGISFKNPRNMSEENRIKARDRLLKGRFE